MKPSHRRAAVFFSSLAFFCGLAWLGGFDFDRRGADVAIHAFWFFGFSFAAVLFSEAFVHENA